MSIGGSLYIRQWSARTGLGVRVYSCSELLPVPLEEPLKDTGVVSVSPFFVVTNKTATGLVESWYGERSPFGGEYVLVEGRGRTEREAWEAFLAELVRLRLLTGAGTRAEVNVGPEGVRRCSKCDRVPFASMEDARITGQSVTRQTGTRMVPYLGRGCGWYHLTTDLNASKGALLRLRKERGS